MDWTPNEVVFQQGSMAPRKHLKSSEQNGGTYNSDLQLNQFNDNESQERENIVLWKKPVTTLYYFVIELCLNLQEYALK